MSLCADATAALSGAAPRPVWRVARLLCALLCVQQLACFSDHPCRVELCDGIDNDCDGRTDEDFLNRSGLYVGAEHCGSCGLRCADVFPSALASECVVSSGQALCRIKDCGPGQVMAGAGACVPQPPVVCLPCASDADCALRAARARCVVESNGAGRCGQACVVASDCPAGFVCTNRPGGAAQCVAKTGSCSCDDSMVGTDFACALASASRDRVCAGVQHCTQRGLSACEALLQESCNGADDDCDGLVDEGFVDGSGRYVGPLNCGSCGSVCAAPGPNMRASCEAQGGSARCQVSCLHGFVDTDGIAADGCECQLNPARAPLVGGDQNCDGIIDPTPALVFVSQAGDDQNSGLLPGGPVRSIARGMALGATYGRTVLLARGIYQGPVELLAGLTLVGGYSPDFHERDPELYPVLLEAEGVEPGVPVLRAIDIDRPTYVAGLTIAGSDAIASGQGSSALLVSGSTANLEFEDVTVLAGRGAAGARGADSSDRLIERGISSLAQLAGSDAMAGQPGGMSCGPLAAGSGGVKMCAGSNVSGGDGGGAQCAAISCKNAVACGNSGCTDFTSGGRCDIAAAKRVAVPNPNAGSGHGAAPGRGADATYDAPTNHGVCSFCDDNPSLPRVGGTGEDGTAGVAGVAGPGCAGAVELDAYGRAQAGGGAWGADGTHGSGGGGGTAGAGYAVIAGTTGGCVSVAGGSGGGAGSGGCGAPGAAGGGGGGVSAGIVIVLPAGVSVGPSFKNVRIVTASGGDGGDGGVGALGGAGGAGGLGGVSSFWCARNGGRGGDGGIGGAGGGGGGGCGGASLGVYVAPNGASLANYAQSLQLGTRVEIAGAAGRGGRGGFSPGHAGTGGLDGFASAVLVGGP
jgi:hypothetical protein